MDDARLEALLQHPALWRAATAQRAPRAIPTTFRRLDEHLPGGGWPLGTLIELLVPAHGVGELDLLIPALRRLDDAEPGARRWIAWICPPHLPYAPALARAGLAPGRMLIVEPGGPCAPSRPATGTRTALWAMEQALRSRACAAALCWMDAVDARALRRLKLAAAEGASLGVLFRPVRRARESSPASLRLLLETCGRELDVLVVKSRGGRPVRVRGVMGGRTGRG